MSKRTAARAAAITAALAKLSNSWGERKERQRMEKLRAYQEQLAASQLRERQYEESTRPTIEQKMAQLAREEEMAGLNLEGRKLDIENKKVELEKSRRPPKTERRTFKEIATDIGVGADEQYAATEALEASNNDFDKAIAALAGPGPAGAGDASIDATGTDPRARGRLLLQRVQREWRESGGGAASPGESRKRTEAQVDAVSMRSAMQANAMIQNPQAPFEEKAQSWLTLERLGILRAPEEVKDWVRLGHKTPEQIAETQQAKGPPAQETRVPRPIKQGTTTMEQDRAAIAERAQRRESDRMMARRTSGRPPEAGEIMEFLMSGKSRLAPTTGPMNDYPPENVRPVEQRRMAGRPYAQPEIGPPYPGVDPEQSRQMDLDAFMQSQSEMAPQPQPDPLQVMFDRIRDLREALKGSQSTGQGF